MKRRTNPPKGLPTKRRKVTPQQSKSQFRTRGFNVEKKVFDLTPTQFQVNTTGQFNLLCSPQAGPDINERIGRKIQIKSVYIRGLVSSEAGDQDGPVVTTSPGQLARMIVFTDNQPNGAAPAVTDLLQSASALSQLNINGRDRFKIHIDKQWALKPYAYNNTSGFALAALSDAIAYKKFKVLNEETIFNATVSATITQITSGALYMFFIGTVPTGANDATAAFSTRVRYTDM